MIGDLTNHPLPYSPPIEVEESFYYKKASKEQPWAVINHHCVTPPYTKHHYLPAFARFVTSPKKDTSVLGYMFSSSLNISRLGNVVDRIRVSISCYTVMGLEVPYAILASASLSRVDVL